MALTCIPHTNGNNYHIARGDFTIGEYRTKSFSDIQEMIKFIITIKPVELVFDVDFPEKENVSLSVQQATKLLISIRDIPPDPEKFIA